VVAEVTDGNFETLVMGSAEPFFLLFTSPWCTTCKRISPFLPTLSQRYPRLGFGRIDISTSPVVPSEHEVLSIPSLIVFMDGKEVSRLTGHLDEEKLEQEAAKFST
jgi:thioredoxin-like negative regulator of GroEL